MANRPPLTRQQARVLDFIRDYRQSHGIAPTLDEIGQALGVHRVTIFEHVKALEQKKRIATSRQLSRSIRVLDDDQPAETPPGPELEILGRIAAGAPIDAIEDRETFSLADWIPRHSHCYLLRVRGDSMIDDHIRDGDLVLVEQRAQAQPGETVVALIRGEEATLKRYYPMGARVRLEPRNPTLQPIFVDAKDVTVQGTVIGVLRRY